MSEKLKEVQSSYRKGIRIPVNKGARRQFIDV